MQNYSISFLFVTLISSCGIKQGAHESNTIPFSIDTVLVNSKDQLIMASSNIFLSGLSEDCSILYNYDSKNSEIEVINLNSLELQRKIKIDRDGPNGVGTVFWFGVPNDSLFMFFNLSRIEFLDQTGSKKTSHKLSKSSFFGQIIQKGQRLSNNFCLIGSTDKLIVPIVSWENDLSSITYLDFGNQKTSAIDHPEILSINDYKIVLKKGNNLKILVEDIFFLYHDGYVFISNSASTDIFRYSCVSNDLHELNIKVGKLPSKPSRKFRLETESLEQFEAQAHERFDEITYMAVVFDHKSDRFYRLAQKRVQRGSDNVPGKYETYLIQYNRAFVLEAETTIEQFHSEINEYFAKDGKIWIRTNLDDELGFTRISLQ